ncbi:hypothetical protein [Halobacteriovorax sp.]|uniref:hypothetical protein n=1 Tax=Halobacteriovorax sp. TaxID=2020862 RepID=UPI003561767A
MKKIVILLTIFLSSQAVFSQAKKSSFDYTTEIHTKISKIKVVAPEDFIGELEDLKVDLENFFDHKRKVCNGEFSSLILVASASKDGGGNKLSDEERSLCFRELKALQTTYVNNLFLARKRFLTWSFEKNIKSLDSEREKAIKSLQGSFDKKGLGKESR